MENHPNVNGWQDVVFSHTIPVNSWRPLDSPLLRLYFENLQVS